MQSVRQLLNEKNQRTLISVNPDSTVFQTLQVMAEHDIGAVLVMEKGNIVGIFSERDYARRIVLQGRASVTTPVRDIMTSKVVCVKPDNTIQDCMTIMTEKHIRHLPVLEDGIVIGVLSIGDLVHATIIEKDFEIDQLVGYINK